MKTFEPAGTVSELLPFHTTLAMHGLKLDRAICNTLQINLGLLCNQSCNHCHLSAGPGRTEIMDPQTISEVVSYAERGRFPVVDITGGAPELNPWIEVLIQGLARLSCRIMFRSNLSALCGENGDRILALLKRHGVAILASFPSLSEAETDFQRGKGVFQASLTAIRKLNAAGYGLEGSGYELDLVSNPAGAYLPMAQNEAEERFRELLREKWSLSFHHLFTFANVPLGRFRPWLRKSGKLDTYLAMLASAFNPGAVAGVMCRSLVSVSWQGYLYDCDFHLAADLPMGGQKVHVSEASGPPLPGSPLVTAEHCYACTAGSGFT